MVLYDTGPVLKQLVILHSRVKQSYSMGLLFVVERAALNYTSAVINAGGI